MVTSIREGSRILVAATSHAAHLLGIRAGMAVTQARAQVPNLDIRPADPAGDRADLERLAITAARHWSPIVALSGEDGLFIELTGTTHLFGGEERMARRIVRLLARMGVQGADRGSGYDGRGLGAGALRPPAAGRRDDLPTRCAGRGLSPLPIAALRAEPDAIELLKRLGVETIGELVAMPRAPLARRFGKMLVLRIDQASGRIGEPLHPVIPPEHIAVIQRFAEPIATAEAIEHWLALLMPRLVAALTQAGQGARAIELVADRIDGVPQRLRIGLARPNRDPAHLLRLIVRRIEEIAPGFGIDALALHVRRADPLGPVPFEERLEETPPDIAPLVDTLANRIGDARLWRTRPVESDVPERSVEPAPALDPPKRAAAPLKAADVRRLDRTPDLHPWHHRWPRPVRMLRRPELLDHVIAELPDQPPRRFTWRGTTHKVVRADGPERVHGEWWKRATEQHSVRDYFRVEDEAGQRFWLFRRGDGERVGDGRPRLVHARGVRVTWSELQVTTHYSFLRGASSPEQLFAAAALAGMPALGITDRNSVGGVVRALVAAEQITEQGYPIRMIAGCRLDLVDGTSLLVWPEDRPAWSRLTRLLTLGKGRADAQKGEKGQCFLHWEDVAAHATGLVGALVPGLTETFAEDQLALRWMADVFGERGHLCLTQHRRPGDPLRLHLLAEKARQFGLTPLATGDVLYDKPERRMLQDVVTAIRNTCTIDDLGFRRERSADRHLKSPEEMVRRFKRYPEAIAASEAIVERCTFSLRELKEQYRYPDEVVISGRSPQDALAKMARTALEERFAPEPIPPAYTTLLEHELALVEQMGYAPYFLTVNSIVRFARSQEILCQGRGSAANSVICFVLGITSIDPVKHQLLFERFISTSRHEPPDIDVDFEHERREEVIQWIYETYGENHAALTAVVSRFRTRGALREVGKALGLSEDMTAALSGQVWGWSSDGLPPEHVEALNLDPHEQRLALTLDLAKQLIGAPRHLSQHPGGFVLAQDRLDELLPIEPAAMIDRRVVEWEKLDVEELGLMKVDILGLGMLGCMRRTFDLLRAHKNLDLRLDNRGAAGPTTPRPSR